MERSNPDRPRLQLHQRDSSVGSMTKFIDVTPHP
jgi:hypothetical protein